MTARHRIALEAELALAEEGDAQLQADAKRREPSIRPRTGIHAPADLRARCSVERATGCWRWSGARDANGRPSFWFAALNARVSLGIAACWWAKGRRPAKGEAWHISCTTPDCANPAHRVCGNRSTQMLAAKMERTPQQRLVMAVARRKGSKLTDADVAAITESTEPLNVLAERFGVSKGYVCSVRSGKVRPMALAEGVKLVIAPRRLLPHEKLRAQPVFASLGIGSYLPSDSAISRSGA